MKKSKGGESSSESTRKMGTTSKTSTDDLADRDSRPIEVADAPAIQAHARVPETADEGKWSKGQSSRRRSSVSAPSRKDSGDLGSRGDGAASYRKSSSPRPDRRPRLSVSPPRRQLEGLVDSTTSPIDTEASVASTPRPSFMSTSPRQQQQQQQQEEEAGQATCSPARTPNSEEPLVLAVASPHPPAVVVPYPTTVQATGLAMAARRTEGSGDSPGKVEVTSKTVTVVAPAASVSQAAVAGAAAGAAAAAAASGVGPPTLTCSFGHAKQMEVEGKERASRVAEGARSDVMGEIPEVARDLQGPQADQLSESDETRLEVAEAPEPSEDMSEPCPAPSPEGHQRGAFEKEEAGHAEGKEEDGDDAENVEEKEEGEKEEKEQSRDGEGGARPKEEERDHVEDGVSEAGGDADGSNDASEEARTEPVTSSSQRPAFTKDAKNRGDVEHVVEESRGSDFVEGGASDGHDQDQERTIADPSGESAGGETGQTANDRETTNKPSVPTQGGEKRETAEADPVPEEGVGEGAEGLDNQEPDGDPTAAAAAAAGAGAGNHGDAEPATSEPSEVLVAAPGPHGEDTPEEEAGVQGEEEQEEEGEKMMEENVAAPAEDRDGSNGAEDAAGNETSSSPQGPSRKAEEDDGTAGRLVEEAGGISGAGGGADEGYAEDDERMLPEPTGDSVDVEGERIEEVNDSDVPSLPQNLPRGEEQGGSADASSRAEAGSVSETGAGEGAAGSRGGGLDSAPAAADRADAGDPVDEEAAMSERSDALVAAAAPRDGEPHEEGGEKEEEEEGERVEEDASASVEDESGPSAFGDTTEKQRPSSPQAQPASGGEEDGGHEKEAVGEGGSIIVAGEVVDEGYAEDDERMLSERAGDSVDAEGDSSEEVKVRGAVKLPQTLPQDGEMREAAEADSGADGGVGEAAEESHCEVSEGALAATAAAGTSADEAHEEKPSTTSRSDSQVATASDDGVLHEKGGGGEEGGEDEGISGSAEDTDEVAGEGPAAGGITITSSPEARSSGKEGEDGGKGKGAVGEVGGTVVAGEVIDDGYAEDDERMLPDPAGDSVEGESSEQTIGNLTADSPPVLPQRGDGKEAAGAGPAVDEGAGEGAEGVDHEGLGIAPAVADDGTSTDEAHEDTPLTTTRSDSTVATGGPQDEALDKKEEKEREAEQEGGADDNPEAAAGEGTSSASVLPSSLEEEDRGQAQHSVEEAARAGDAEGAVDEGYEEGDERMLTDTTGSTVEGGSKEEARGPEDAGSRPVVPEGEEKGEAAEEAASGAAGGFDHEGLGGALADPGGAGTGDPVDDEPATQERTDAPVAIAGLLVEKVEKEEEENGQEPEAAKEDEGVSAPAEEAKVTEDKGQAEHGVEEAGRHSGAAGGVDSGYEEDDERMLPDAAGGSVNVEGESTEEVNEQEDAGSRPVVPQGGKKGEAAKTESVEDKGVGGAAEGFDHEGLAVAVATAGRAGAADPADDEPPTHERSDALVVTAGREEEDKEDKAAKQEAVEEDAHVSAPVEEADGAEDLGAGNDNADAPESETTSSPQVLPARTAEEDKDQKQHAVEESGSARGVGGGVDSGYEEDDERMLPDAAGGSVDAEGESGNEAKNDEVAGVPQIVPPGGEETEEAADDSAGGKSAGEGAEGFDHDGLDGAPAADDEGMGTESDVDDKPSTSDRSDSTVATGGPQDEALDKKEQGQVGEEQEVLSSSMEEEDRGQAQHAVEEAARVGGAEGAIDGGYEEDDERMLPDTTGKAVKGGSREEANKHEDVGSRPVVPQGGETGEAAKADPVAEEGTGGAAEGVDHDGLDGARATAGGAGAGDPVDDEPPTHERSDALVAAAGPAEQQEDKEKKEKEEEEKAAGGAAEGLDHDEPATHERSDALAAAAGPDDEELQEKEEQENKEKEEKEEEEEEERAAGGSVEGLDHDGLDGARATAGEVGAGDPVDDEPVTYDQPDALVAITGLQEEEVQHKDGRKEEEVQHREGREEEAIVKRENREEGDGSSAAGAGTIVERGVRRQKEEQGTVKSPPVLPDSQAGGGGTGEEDMVVPGTKGNSPRKPHDEEPGTAQLAAMKAPAFGSPGGEGGGQGGAVVMEEEKEHEVVVENAEKEVEEEVVVEVEEQETEVGEGRVVDGGEPEEEQGQDEVGVVVEEEHGEDEEGMVVEEEGENQEEEAVAQQKDKEEQHAVVKNDEMTAGGEKSRGQQDVPATEHDEQGGDKQVGDVEVVDSPVEAAVASKERDRQQEDHQPPAAPATTAAAGESGSSSGVERVQADGDSKGGAATTRVPTVAPKTASGTEKGSVEKGVVSVPPTSGEVGPERAGGGGDHLSGDGSSSLLETIKEMMKKGRSCCP